MVIRRGGSQILRKKKTTTLTAPLLITITRDCFMLKKESKITVSQLRALATHTPILGRVAQSPLSSVCLKLGSAIF